MLKIHRRPELDIADAAEAIREHYGLEGTLTPLKGERDLNFRLETAAGERFVVKVSSPDEVDEILHIEVDLTRHLAELTDGFAPDVVAATGGERVIRHTDSAGTEHRIRVVEYLEGGLFADVRPRSTTLLYDLGRRVAEVDSALGAYPDHPPARIDFDWALGRSGMVMERCFDLFEGEELTLVRRIHEAWLRREPDFLGLGSQVIHGDLNDHNILVSAPGEGPRHVTGIIDLGDAHSAPRVFDLGIALAYAVLGTPDPLMAAAAVVRGFHERTPLLEYEADVVWALLRARLGASVSISRWRKHESGKVDEYHAVSERPAWEMIRRLDGIHERLAEGVMRDACGLPACPRTPVLVDWLREQKVEPLMERPESDDEITVLDLGVSSPELDGRDTDDTEAFTRRVFRHMEDAGASLGIARRDDDSPQV